MKHARIKMLAGILTLMVLAFFGGVSLGRRASFKTAIRLLDLQTQRELRTTTEALAHLRNHNYQETLTQLETRLDSGLETLPRTVSWSDLNFEMRHAYMIAKAYRTVFPPTTPTKDLERALREIPLPEKGKCSPALQEALAELWQ